MILSHFSRKHFRINRSRIYVQIDNFKPTGLWLSDESGHGWQKWCKTENYATDSLKFEARYECDTSKWLVLNTPNKVVKFSKKYEKLIGSYYTEIQWDEVKKDFAGILITPYHWSLRLDRRVAWYYSWDVASACVWDLSTVGKRMRPRIPSRMASI